MYIKKALVAAIVAAIVTITAFAQFNPGSPRTAPTGSWEGVVTNLDGGPPPFRMLMTFTADGGWIGSSDGDSNGASAGHGVWEQVGGGNSRTFAVTFRQIQYDQNSVPTASVTVRQTFILDDAGNTMEGPGEVKVFLADGTLVFTGRAVATATRIISDPLP